MRDADERGAGRGQVLDVTMLDQEQREAAVDTAESVARLAGAAVDGRM